METNLKKNPNLIWGLLLIALGGFLFLQVTGIFGVLTTLFWALLLGAAGAVFIYVFLSGLHTRWWAAIPGFTLLGLAATIFYGRFAPFGLSQLSGAVFLGSIGISFIAIFLANPQLWWAIIPGGALLSLAGVAAVMQMGGGFLNPASVLFIGLGLTFGVLGLLSTYLHTNLRWAYIPAAVLLVLGLVIFSPFMGVLGYLWPLLLIGGGAYLVLKRPNLAQLKAYTAGAPAAPASQGAPGSAPAASPQSIANGGTPAADVKTKAPVA